MPLGTSAICFGLSAAATGLRITEGGRSTTTNFVIEAFTYYSDSKVNCVAHENLHIRAPDGTTRQVLEGERLFSTDAGVHNDINRYRLPYGWETLWAVRQAATLKVEIEDPADRHIPRFKCQVQNSANGLECEAPSTGGMVVNFPRRCAVEITNMRNGIDFEINETEQEIDIETTEKRTKFYVAGWTTTGQSKLQCISNVDIVGENSVILQGAEIFGATTLQERKATPQEATPKVWEITEEVVIFATSDLQKCGFTCKIISENGKDLCQATSWEPTPGMVATKPDGCLVKITRNFQDLAVQYPIGFFRGWTSFSITARALKSIGERELMLDCRGSTDMTLETDRTGLGHGVPKNGALFVPKKVQDWRDRNMRLDFRNYNKHVDTFVCTVTENENVLCTASSLDIAPVLPENAECSIKIEEIGRDAIGK